VKQFALSAALLMVVGVVTQAQDRDSGISLPITTSASVSDGAENRTPVSASSAPTLPKPLCDIQDRNLAQSRSEFTTSLENSSPNLLTPCRKSYNSPTHPRALPASGEDDADLFNGEERKFQWSSAIKQSLVFLGVQHSYAMTQPKTRRDLKGPFIKDYFRSVKSLHGWADGGRFFTNYVAHPMQGSFLGFIEVQNDPKAKRLRFGKSSAYWRSRLKALAWSAVWSTQFEIGPVSQASIGNVGLHGKQTYVDLVMTPIGGIGLLVAEDFLDKNLIEKIERSSGSFYLKIASRMLFNPTRSVANLLRLKKPWYRDSGLR
jgi:hypothetical protein